MKRGSGWRLEVGSWRWSPANRQLPTADSVVAAVLLVALVLIAHGAVVSQWWLWDDPQLLHGAMRFGAGEHFSRPAAWQEQSAANFVPMLMLATEVDLALFGAEPRGFYVHHLLIFIAAMLAVYAYCRTFASPLVAWIAGAAVALSQPAFTVASLLMDRHYVEGLLLSVLALILFRRSHEHPWRAVAATVFYLVACLEKEVFVPLPLLVVVQDWIMRIGLRVWLRNALLCGAATLIYVAWRIFMLGSFGGFGSASGSMASLSSAGLSIVAGVQGKVAAGFALALFLFSLRHDPLRRVIVVLAGAIVVILPIAGLAVHDSRYFFVAAVVIMVLAASAVQKPRSVELALFAALAASIAMGGLVHRASLRPQLEMMQRDGLYLWRTPVGGGPLFTGAQGWYIEGVQWLRTAVRGDRAPDAVASLPGLLLRGLTAQDVVFTTPQNADQFVRAADVVRANFDPAMPLRLRLVRRGRVLSWSLGPAAAGDAFFFVTPVQELVWTRTAAGWVRLPAEVAPPTAGSAPRTVRVMRRSGEKWTVSPPLVLPGDGQTLQWER